METFLFNLFYVFEHAEGHLPLNLFRDARIQSRIKRNDRVIIYQGILNDRFDAEGADTVSRDVNSLDVLVVSESLLQTSGELVPELVSAEDQLAKATLVQDQLTLMVDQVRLVL